MVFKIVFLLYKVLQSQKYFYSPTHVYKITLMFSEFLDTDHIKTAVWIELTELFGFLQET